VIDGPAKSPHEKYLSLYKLMRSRDKDVATAFNDFCRSTAVMQLGIIHGMGLLTGGELRRFSPETLQRIEWIAPILQD
jgi:hypothetical protein